MQGGKAVDLVGMATESIKNGCALVLLRECLLLLALVLLDVLSLLGQSVIVISQLAEIGALL
jgi:hypothetical protein